MLRTVKLGAGCLLLTVSLHAQKTSPQVLPPSKSQKLATCSIAGVVVRAGTNEPIRKARVSLFSMNSERRGYGGSTDVEGRFLVDGIPPGRYQLAASRHGYVTRISAEDSSKHRRVVLALEPGKDITDLVFRMTPWSVISGRITDEDGDPVAQAEVAALQSYMDAGQRKLSVNRTASTNDLGEYRLYGLAKGRYYLRAEYADRHANMKMSSTSKDSSTVTQTGYAPIFYPGTAEVARASAVAVAAGQEVPSIDFRLIPTRTVRIRGSVFSTIPGKFAMNCCVYLRPRDRGLESDAFHGQGNFFIGPNGTYEIDNVVPGSFFVGAAVDVERYSYFAEVPVEVGNTNLEDINLTILPGIVLAGRVAVEGGGPFELSTLQVNLVADDSSVRTAEVKAEGTFKFTDVAAGTYELDVSEMPPVAYLKSARNNGEDVLNGRLNVGAEGSHDAIEIRLSMKGYQLDGAVTDEEGGPVAGATVVLIPEEKRRKFYRLYKAVVTDQYGKFLLRGIAPGDYKVFAWQEIENNAWEDPEFLRPFEANGVEVRAKENAHTSVTVKVLPSAPKELP